MKQLADSLLVTKRLPYTVHRIVQYILSSGWWTDLVTVLKSLSVSSMKSNNRTFKADIWTFTYLAAVILGHFGWHLLTNMVFLLASLGYLMWTKVWWVYSIGFVTLPTKCDFACALALNMCGVTRRCTICSLFLVCLVCIVCQQSP